MAARSAGRHTLRACCRDSRGNMVIMILCTSLGDTAEAKFCVISELKFIRQTVVYQAQLLEAHLVATLRAFLWYIEAIFCACGASPGMCHPTHVTHGYHAIRSFAPLEHPKATYPAGHRLCTLEHRQMRTKEMGFVVLGTWWYHHSITIVGWLSTIRGVSSLGLAAIEV